MMSLSSHDAVKTTADVASDQAAEPRGVRPGVETPAFGRLLCHPDLLERRPVVGRALRPKERPAVGRLEPDVHLQPAVIRAAAVSPAALVVVDAEGLIQVRRPLRPPVGHHSPPLPEGYRRLDVLDAHLGEDTSLGRRPRHSHQVLPAPSRTLVGVDLLREPGDRRLAGLRLLAQHGRVPAHLRQARYRHCLFCFLTCNSLWRTGCARTASEQAGAGQGESPQETPPPSGFDCLVVEPAAGGALWTSAPPPVRLCVPGRLDASATLRVCEGCNRASRGWNYESTLRRKRWPASSTSNSRNT